MSYHTILGLDLPEASTFELCIENLTYSITEFFRVTAQLVGPYWNELFYVS